MIENYKAMIQHKRVDTHTPESESNPSTTDTALPVTPNHCDGNYIDLEPGQSNLPAVSIRSDYQSSSQYPEPSNQAAQDDNTFEGTKIVIIYNGSVKKYHKYCPQLSSDRATSSTLRPLRRAMRTFD